MTNNDSGGLQSSVSRKQYKMLNFTNFFKNYKNVYKKTKLDYLHNFQITISCFIPNYNSTLLNKRTML